MTRIVVLSVAVVLLVLAGLVWPLGTAWGAEKSAGQLRRTMRQGNYKDGYDGLSAMVLTAEGTDALNADYNLCLTALQSLGRVDEQDEFMEKAIAVHKGDWQFVWNAGRTYRDLSQHYGAIVAGKFHRGERRGGPGGNDGKWVSAFDRDRTRALQLYVQAMGLMDKDAGAAWFYYDLSKTLMAGQNGPDGWRLQYLTELGTLPDYEETARYGWYGRGYGYNGRGAPVDEKGNPIFHYVPKGGWEGATSDGQRWRWARLQVSELSPALGNSIRWEFAGFLRGQFDVQTMAYYGGLFRHSDEDAKKDESGAYAAWTLGEDETIAKLANGVKRFKLPDEFNFIRMFQTIAADEKGGGQRADAMEQLARIFSDRQQYPKAAEWWKKCIEKFGPGDNAYREKALQQIVANWGMFENVLVQPSGGEGAAGGASVQYRYRNGTKVSFEAKEIEVATLLEDVKAHLRAKPKQLDWEKIDVGNIGYRLVEKNQAKYVGAQVAAWDVELKPRAGHFDRRITVTTPPALKKAGAYLLTGKMGEGNVSRIVVWVADTAIVRKPLSDASMTYVADAVTGLPIEGAKLDFFGYRQEWKQEKVDEKNYRQTYEMFIAEKSAETNAEGMALVDFKAEDGKPQVKPEVGFVQVPKTVIPNNMTWLTTATTKDGRLAFMGFSGIWYSAYYDQYDAQYNQTKAYFVTDRPVYRPGQAMKWKLWMGENKYDKDGKSRFAGQSVDVEIHSPKGDVIKKVTGTMDEWGGIDGEMVLEKEATLGVYSINAPGVGAVSFRVEEYKKPEFEVKVDAPADPVMLGEKVPATITAKYYFGAAVVNAKVKYKVTRTAHDARWYPAGRWDWYYEPGYWWFACDYGWYPGWAEWGCKRPFHPWWGGWSREQPEVVLDGEAAVGADGTVKLEIDTAVAKAAYGDQDHKYEITAEVTDASRRTIVGTGTVLVARKPFKVYAWVDRGYYQAGQVIGAHFCAQTLDNKPVTGKGVVKLLRVTYEKGVKAVETEVQRWAVDPKEDGTAELQITAAAAGQYRLSYTVTDAKGRAIEGGYVVMVRGKAGEGFDGKEFRFNDIEVITDKKQYAAGEKVKLMVNTNRADAAVLLFVRPSNGIYLAPKVIRMKGKSTVEEIEVGKKDMPNFFIEAVTVANAKVYAEVREVIVPPEDRVLNVTVTSDKSEYRPGTKAKIKLAVTEKNGEPFTGAAVLSLYDKAVEYISGGSNVTDIRKYFWQWRRTHYVRNESSLDRGSGNLVRSTEIPMGFLGVFGVQAADFGEGDEKAGADASTDGLMQRGGGGGGGGFGRGMQWAQQAGMPMSAAAPGGAPMAGDRMNARSVGGMDAYAAKEESKSKRDELGVDTGDAAAPSVRTNFADTAFWGPRLVTAKDGTAEVEVTMPENLSTWKAKVWTLGAGTRVGQGEAEVITAKKLIVRLEAPRFFVQTDEVVISAIVHNYLASSKDVKVTMELEGGTLESMTELTVSPAAGRERVVHVDPKGEARVDWRVRVLKEGVATIRIKGITDEESDATQMSFPVYVHGMLKMDSFSGAVRGNAKSAYVNYTVPKERRAGDSRLEVRYSPSLATAMVDALPYLVDYPYGCTEQTLNKFVPTVITQKILLDMKLDLAAIEKKRTNLNAQEIGEDAARAKQWGTQGIQNSEFRIQSWKNPVFSKDEVDKMVKTGVARLQNMQLGDGGWGWFSGYGEQSYPHTTAVVIHGLMLAKENGAAVDDGVVARGVQWLEAWQNTRYQWIVAKRNERKCDDMDAFAYMVLVDAGKDHKKMRELLYEDRLGLALYTKAMLGLAMVKVKDQDKLDMLLENVRQYIQEDAENQTAFLKMPESNYWWYWYGSDFEANAYVLKLLAKTDPKGKVTSGLAKYIINNRKHATYWNSTRDTAACIEALADYIRASGEDLPDMTVKVLLDGKQVKEVHIDRDNFFSYDNKLVLAGEQVAEGAHKIEVVREGTGPVYFNAYLTNFTLEDHITRAGLEVKVNRKVYLLTRDDKTIKAEGERGQAVDKRVEKYVRTELADGGTLKSGDLVEVEMEVDSKNDYEYIILEDMKAAGFEPMEVRSGYNGNDMGAYVEFRDERVVFFVRWLTRGKHSVSYRLRAEVPGKFSALPAKASAMYAPELKGNSDEIKLRIEDVGGVMKGAGAVPVVPEAVVPVRVRNDKRGG